MSIPAAKVETRITLVGEDRASKVVRDAHGAVREFGHEAESLGPKFHEAGEQAAGAMSKVSRLGRPLSSFAGESSGEIRELSHGLHGFALITELLPGPLGMAAGAIAGLGVVAVLVGKHMEEARAKAKLLWTPESDHLREALNLDAEGASKVAQAMGELNTKAIKPNDELLKEIIERGELLGEKPVEAVKALAEAWKGGAAALLKYEQLHGDIDNLDKDTIDNAAARLGLNREDLGLEEKKLDLKGQLNVEFLNALEAQRQMRKAQQECIDLQDKGIHAASQGARDAANLEANKKKEEFEWLASLSASADKRAKSAQQTLNFLTETNEGAEAYAASIKAIERTEAGSVRNAQLVLANQGLQKAATESLLALDQMRLVIGESAYKAEKGKLETLLDEGKKGVDEAFKSGEEESKKREEARKKAAESGKRVRDEEAAHRIALAKSVGDVESLERNRAAGDDPDKQAAAREADLRAAAAREIRQIQQDSKKKGDVKATEILAAELKLQTELDKLDTEHADKRVQIARALEDARAQLTTARLQAALDDDTALKNLDKLSGDREALAADHLKNELLQIERERVDGLKTIRAEDRAAFIATENAKADAAILAAHRKDGGGDKKNEAEQAAKGHAAVTEAINAVSAAGGKSGAAMSTAAKAAQEMTKNWKGIAAAGPDIASGIGAVASSVVSGEKTKAGIMAITELAAGFVALATPGMEPSAVGHFTASALYASVAGGLIGGAPSASSGGPAGSGSGSGGSGGSPFSPSGQRGVPTQVNVFYGVLGTQQQQGLAVQKAIAATKGTGFSGQGV